MKTVESVHSWIPCLLVFEFFGCNLAHSEPEFCLTYNIWKMLLHVEDFYGN